MSNRVKIYRFSGCVKAIMALTLGLLLWSNSAIAQVKFYQSALASIGINQTLQLDISIQNGNGSNLQLGATPDFQVVGGPSTQTSINIGPGGATQTLTYSYFLKPKQEGTFKIGRATITVNGVSMSSNELTVTVGKAVQQQQRQQQGWDPFADPFFSQQQQQPEPEVSEAEVTRQAKEDVFLKLEVSRGSVYEGEMLTVTYKLCFNQNIESPRMDKAPSFEGYLSQEVELDPKRRPTLQTINGKQYHVVDLMKYNLYPQHPGNLKIPAAECATVAHVPVRTRSRNIFDDFFNGGREMQVPLNLRSETGTVSVKALPEKGKPADFTGAVGKYNFTTSISATEGKTDDPITYTVKISGTGNLKLVDAPTLKLPPVFEVYDPKAKENITNGPAGYTGSKQYDFLIIPRQPGEYKIDGRSFSYFDPSAEKYITVNTPEYNLKITGAPSQNPNAGVAQGVSKQDISLLGQDIRYIKTGNPVFTKNDAPFFGSVGFVAVYSTPALLFFLLIGLRRRNDSMAADVVGVKRRRALKLAKKRLNLADKHLKTNEKKLFYDEVSRAIWGYLGDKLNIDMAGLSKDNVEEKLTVRSVNPDTIVKLKALISTCEMALYAPVTDEQTEMKKNYDTAMNLIADLEDEIKS